MKMVVMHVDWSLPSALGTALSYQNKQAYLLLLWQLWVTRTNRQLPITHTTSKLPAQRKEAINETASQHMQSIWINHIWQKRSLQSTRESERLKLTCKQTYCRLEFAQSLPSGEMSPIVAFFSDVRSAAATALSTSSLCSWVAWSSLLSHR